MKFGIRRHPINRDPVYQKIRQLFEKDRPLNDRRYAVDWCRIAALGWEPNRTLKAMLPGMVKWYRKNISFFTHSLRCLATLRVPAAIQPLSKWLPRREPA